MNQIRVARTMHRDTCLCRCHTPHGGGSHCHWGRRCIDAPCTCPPLFGQWRVADLFPEVTANRGGIRYEH